MTVNELDLRRFAEQLPFFVSGTLDTEQQRWMHFTLGANPELHEQLRWHQALMREVVLQEENAQLQAPADLGWADIQEHLAKSDSLSFFKETYARFMAWFSTPVRVGSFATSLVLFAAGTAVLMGYMVQPEMSAPYSDFRSCGVFSEDRDYAYFQVGFKPNIGEQQIRLVLIQNNISIVAGPTHMGEYTVKVPRRMLESNADLLNSLDVIESVSSIQYPH
ncbi:hypothetical protein [Limnobacter alexandrii]|uniref:hypothetical protein n=1 Tax=Limnobacter alexandrii TaxID=2570352 RepID=UPI00110998ED|nr:hypothetical protein [Limnobacter alexandrii]